MQNANLCHHLGNGVWQPPRLLDFLNLPLAHTNLPSPCRDQDYNDSNNADPSKPISILRDPNWLTLAHDHRQHVRRWKDFNYALLRVALKDVLDQKPTTTPAFSELGPDLRDWPQSVTGLGRLRRGSVGREAILGLGKRLNACLAYAVQDGNLPTDDIPVLQLDVGREQRVERQSGPGDSAREGNGCTLRWDWTLSAEDPDLEDGDLRCVALGLNKTDEEFPLSALGKLDDQGRIDVRLEWALRQLGTACFHKSAWHAFILTPSGAAILLFYRTFRGFDSHDALEPPSGHVQASLGVKYRTIPWRVEPGTAAGMTLPMGLWCLFVIALIDDDPWNVEDRGFGEHLNFWHQRRQGRRRVFRHCLTGQVNRGHPPGALVIGQYEGGWLDEWISTSTLVDSDDDDEPTDDSTPTYVTDLATAGYLDSLVHDFGGPPVTSTSVPTNTSTSRSSMLAWPATGENGQPEVSRDTGSMWDGHMVSGAFGPYPSPSPSVITKHSVSSHESDLALYDTPQILPLQRLLQGSTYRTEYPEASNSPDDTEPLLHYLDNAALAAQAVDESALTDEQTEEQDPLSIFRDTGNVTACKQGSDISDSDSALEVDNAHDDLGVALQENIIARRLADTTQPRNGHKRKQVNVDDPPLEINTPESWRKRLRPRKWRPNYREV